MMKTCLLRWRLMVVHHITCMKRISTESPRCVAQAFLRPSQPHTHTAHIPTRGRVEPRWHCLQHSTARRRTHTDSKRDHRPFIFCNITVCILQQYGKSPPKVEVC